MFSKIRINQTLKRGKKKKERNSFRIDFFPSIQLSLTIAREHAGKRIQTLNLAEMSVNVSLYWEIAIVVCFSEGNDLH